MAPNLPVEPPCKFFTLEEANKMLPLVRVIVGDIVRQNQLVIEIKQRLGSLLLDRRRSASDIYTEELAHSQSELQVEESKLNEFVDELTKLGVELKGPQDGLCDFPTMREGRAVYLCWRLGEPEIQHWHELDAGAAGRQPISISSSSKVSS